MSDYLQELIELAKSLQSLQSKSEAAWRIFDSALQGIWGHEYFTVLAYDTDTNLLCRVYSSRSELQNVGGMKRAIGPWAETVISRGMIFVASTADDIKHVYSKHARLAELGCDSSLNIPVMFGGEVIGSLNLLGRARQYDGVHLGACAMVAQLATGLLYEEQKRCSCLFHQSDVAAEPI
jgi:hypothetical protein